MQPSSDSPSESLLKRIESLTGQSIDQIKAETLPQKRKRIALAKKGPMRFTRNFPLIGRGCVLGDYLTTSSSLNKQLDLLLAKS